MKLSLHPQSDLENRHRLLSNKKLNQKEMTADGKETTQGQRGTTPDWRSPTADQTKAVQRGTKGSEANQNEQKADQRGMEPSLIGTKTGRIETETDMIEAEPSLIGPKADPIGITTDQTGAATDPKTMTTHPKYVITDQMLAMIEDTGTTDTIAAKNTKDISGSRFGKYRCGRFTSFFCLSAATIKEMIGVFVSLSKRASLSEITYNPVFAIQPLFLPHVEVSR